MKKKSIKMEMMPSPPGQFIRDQILEPLDLSITKAAEVMKMRRPTLSDIINDKARLSSDVALRLEKAFGVSMELLLRMQTTYEVAIARDRAGDLDVQPYQSTPAPQ